ncbi:hypothetical protein KEM56_003593 [Ascosphaera pollenicola]|nr:hypothetical protein KEM56_003593 [Ascosphaera pollenicola]
MLEYFSKSAGPVKKVILTYNQNGTSRGIASIIFKQPESAAKAAKNLNGMLVDKKPIKIEVVVDPTKVQAAAASTGSKSLAQRATQPKSTQPAKAAAPKNNAAARGGRRRGRAGRPNKPKPKTAEELDQEMTDYFVQAGAGSGEAAPAGTNGQAPVQDQAPAAAEGDDMGMDDI